MPKLNHFNEVKSYFNSRVGAKFTTKEFHDAMVGIETETPWKRYGNRFYRSDTYKTYLRRLGYLKNLSRGSWEVVKPIPNWLNLGHINFIVFRMWNNKGEVKSYWNATRDEVRMVQQHPCNQLITNRNDFDLFLKIIKK